MTNSGTRLPAGLAIESGSLRNMTQHLRTTTFIGAGGKTTCLRALTQELESEGHQVVATTTTKVYPEKRMIPWRNLNPPPQGQRGAWFWYDRVDDETEKWIGPLVTKVDEAIADQELDRTTVAEPSQRFWVIEGDGARGHKLKCWESYEPQIPKYTDCAVLVVDRGLWGATLQVDSVHRPDCCRDLLGQVWKAESAWNYFLRSPVFNRLYKQMSWVILLNSPDNMIENNRVIDPINSLDLLHDLWYRWLEIQENPGTVQTKPNHLRMAAGDAKKGDLRWFDLW